MKNYYEILGVAETATKDEIRKAYRNFAKKMHPDAGGDEEKFKELAEANDILSDDKKRQEYDAKRKFGGNGGFGFDPFEHMNDFFNRQHTHQTVNKAKEHVIQITIPLSDVYNGSFKKVTYTRKILCKHCKGEGGTRSNCATCNGTGRERKIYGNGFVKQIIETTCGSCNGYGYTLKTKCNHCDNGLIDETKIVELNIPKNIDSGMFIKFNHSGNEMYGGECGDLLIRIIIEEDPNFTKEGNNLFYSQDINPIELLIGKNIDIPHFSGKLHFKIPELVNPYEYIVIPNKGFNGGDLIITMNIVQPSKLTDEQRSRLKKAL